MLAFITKKIKDKRVLWLIKQIVESDSPGVPIGNLTSQLFANIYLNELDQFVKHHLRIKYYLRYMDDFLILDFNKKRLHQIKEIVQKFLQDKLKLKLHPKKANIFPISKGVDFLGYQTFGTYRLLRKDTVKRFIKRTKNYPKRLNKNTLRFWLNYADYGDSWRLRRSLEKKLKVKFNE